MTKAMVARSGGLNTSAGDHGAREAFKAWVASLTSSRQLAERTVTGYEQIWTPWLRFLAGRRKRWDEASAEDFGAFLDRLETERVPKPSLATERAGQGLPTTSKSKSLKPPPKDKKRASHVTLRRYWRVVGEIYGHAVRSGRLEANPVCEANRPRESENASSVVIWPYYLKRLRARLPDGDEPMELRDRALLAVLADVGLTTREIIDLVPAAVSRSTAHDGLVLRVTGPRDPQNREVYLGAPASRDLQRWLDCRRQWEPSADCVFVSMRGQQQLKPTDVLHIVSTWLRANGPRVQLPLVDHMGSNALRTAVLIWWRDVDKLSTEELLQRAGLAEAQALRRLPEPLARPLSKPPIKAIATSSPRHA